MTIFKVNGLNPGVSGNVCEGWSSRLMKSWERLFGGSLSRDFTNLDDQPSQTLTDNVYYIYFHSVFSEGPQHCVICCKCKSHRVERKEAIIELVQTEINCGNDFQILKEV